MTNQEKKVIQKKLKALEIRIILYPLLIFMATAGLFILTAMKDWKLTIIIIVLWIAFIKGMGFLYRHLLFSHWIKIIFILLPLLTSWIWGVMVFEALMQLQCPGVYTYLSPNCPSQGEYYPDLFCAFWGLATVGIAIVLSYILAITYYFYFKKIKMAKE
ncbi:hypothetical protein COT68_01110 [bacterium (Candidatus Torokbacteria) CG09_land_8_20_14_0_10_42_11]|nr:MAG: hypothetical protein COT68_01110 [bacterium (Candidatus Torokbacteria) CG09_land_8_20_14_0_10_42_11]